MFRRQLRLRKAKVVIRLLLVAIHIMRYSTCNLSSDRHWPSLTPPPRSPRPGGRFDPARFEGDTPALELNPLPFLSKHDDVECVAR